MKSIFYICMIKKRQKLVPLGYSKVRCNENRKTLDLLKHLFGDENWPSKHEHKWKSLITFFCLFDFSPFFWLQLMMNKDSLCPDVICGLIVMYTVFCQMTSCPVKNIVLKIFKSVICIIRQTTSRFFLLSPATFSFNTAIATMSLSSKQYDYCDYSVRLANGVGIDVPSEPGDHGVGAHHVFLKSKRDIFVSDNFL